MGMIQREVPRLEVSYQEATEDYLGVALIRSGDSVIIINEEGSLMGSIRVEPREYYSSLLAIT